MEPTTTTLSQQHFTGERALFHSRDLVIVNSVFSDGESPLKESRNITLQNCLFEWKYPLWYCSHIKADNCLWAEMGRAGVWYTDDITVTNALIQAPKNFRRCEDLTLSNVSLPHAAETLWNCRKVRLEKVDAAGDYFAMNCEDLTAKDFTLSGNYSFDGVKNAVIQNAKLLSKDAFWNSENITVYDSFISGEYLGWNAKNLTLINCTVESLQGLCYIDGLTMKNCRLINTTLAFEYATVEADLVGQVDSVLNPAGGRITADRIGTLIMEKDKIDPDKTKIILRDAE